MHVGVMTGALGGNGKDAAAVGILARAVLAICAFSLTADPVEVHVAWELLASLGMRRIKPRAGELLHLRQVWC